MRLSFHRKQEPIKMSVWLDLSCKADFDTSASGSEFIRSYALPYKILSKFKKIIKRRNIKINQTIIRSVKACFALAKNSTSVLWFASFKVYEGNQVRITLVVPWAYYAFWVIFFSLIILFSIYKDRSFHCDVCNVCLDKRLEGKHKCRPNSGHDECCICLEVIRDHISYF